MLRILVTRMLHYVHIFCNKIYFWKKKKMFNLSFIEVGVIPNQNMFLFRVTTLAKLKMSLVLKGVNEVTHLTPPQNFLPLLHEVATATVVPPHTTDFFLLLTQCLLQLLYQLPLFVVHIRVFLRGIRQWGRTWFGCSIKTTWHTTTNHKAAGLFCHWPPPAAPLLAFDTIIAMILWWRRWTRLASTTRRWRRWWSTIGTPSVQVLSRGRGGPSAGRTCAGQLSVAGVPISDRKRRKGHWPWPLFFTRFGKGWWNIERWLALGGWTHFVYGYRSALAQTGVQAIQLCQQNLGEQGTGTGAAA